MKTRQTRRFAPTNINEFMGIYLEGTFCLRKKGRKIFRPCNAVTGRLEIGSQKS